MASFDHLIVGGGMTADAAARAIRARRPGAKIALFSRETHPPYARPPLSKALWKGDPEESIWRKTEETGAEMFLGRGIAAIDPKKRRAVDERGETHDFGSLLLATGGRPRRLPGAPDEVIYFRTLDDFRRLKAAAAGDRVAVIGGGFIGSELAAALAIDGKPVTMLFPEDGIGARVYPRRLSDFLVSYYREKGVDVRPGETVTSIERRDGFRILLGRGGEIRCDTVVAGLGIEPEVGLARDAGLEVENGIVVDERLETSAPGIYAAGDVANFFNPALGRRMRVEHEDGANTMGETAGANMAGDSRAYDHLPFFYSDLFDLGYEAVGEIDSRHDVVEDWKEEFREGVVYYLRDGRVRGVLLWNTWGQVENARVLIAEKGPFPAAALRGRLPA
jgi:NADPH-dependent 2,4-dienoyl-CoA reductase/sulfur reductase-like enzyme